MPAYKGPFPSVNIKVLPPGKSLCLCRGTVLRKCLTLQVSCTLWQFCTALNCTARHCNVLHTIAQTEGIVSFAEADEISIGPKTVRLHWPVLPDCWRSVEVAIDLVI